MIIVSKILIRREEKIIALPSDFKLVYFRCNMLVVSSWKEKENRNCTGKKQTKTKRENFEIFMDVGQRSLVELRKILKRKLVNKKSTIFVEKLFFLRTFRSNISWCKLLRKAYTYCLNFSHDKACIRQNNKVVSNLWNWKRVRKKMLQLILLKSRTSIF